MMMIIIYSIYFIYRQYNIIPIVCILDWGLKLFVICGILKKYFFDPNEIQ